MNWRGEPARGHSLDAGRTEYRADFLGVNLKCNACHDSFISKWKLKDAYSLAASLAPEPTLQIYRCDVALDRFAGARFPVSGADAETGLSTVPARR